MSPTPLATFSLFVASTLLISCGGAQTPLVIPGGGAGAAPIGAGQLLLANLPAFLVALVALMLLWAVRQGRNDRRGIAPAGKVLRLATMGGALAAIGMLAAHLRSLNEDLRNSEPAEPLSVQISARPGWWEIRYPSSEDDEWVITANELVLPAYLPALIVVSTGAGRPGSWSLDRTAWRDPAREEPRILRIDPLPPGRYRTQCPELCILGPGSLVLEVLVVPPDSFRHWLDAQGHSPAAPIGHSVPRLQADPRTRGFDLRQLSLR